MEKVLGSFAFLILLAGCGGPKQADIVTAMTTGSGVLQDRLSIITVNDLSCESGRGERYNCEMNLSNPRWSHQFSVSTMDIMMMGMAGRVLNRLMQNNESYMAATFEQRNGQWMLLSVNSDIRF